VQAASTPLRIRQNMSKLRSNLSCPAHKGMPWRLKTLLSQARKRCDLADQPGCCILKGSKMPKLKTKSGAKKRFKITGTGKVMFTQAGKRHGMIKRTKKFIRQARGMDVLSDQDAKIVKKYMPYAR